MAKLQINIFASYIVEHAPTLHSRCAFVSKILKFDLYFLDNQRVGVYPRAALQHLPKDAFADIASGSDLQLRVFASLRDRALICLVTELPINQITEKRRGGRLGARYYACINICCGLLAGRQ